MARKAPKKPKTLPIGKIKKLLHDDWSKRVRERDEYVCQMCGRGKTYIDGDGTEKNSRLSGHHWWRTAHRGGWTRYMIENGVTLCFTCHNRGVHVDADYYTTAQLRRRVQACYRYDVCEFLGMRLRSISDSECRQLALDRGLIEKAGNALVKVKRKKVKQ